MLVQDQDQDQQSLLQTSVVWCL